MGYDSIIATHQGTDMTANLSQQEIRNAINAGKEFVLLNARTGEVISLHKSRDSAIRKAAKIGGASNVQNLRVGYVY